MLTKQTAVPRPASEVQEQLDRFKASLPDASFLPANDFAAQLQWDAWQNHLHELEAELQAAIEYELAGSDVSVSLDGDPVVGHDIQAGFLGTVLAHIQNLSSAIAQSFTKATGRAPIANTIVEESRLMFAGTYHSSFGIRLRFATESELGRIRSYSSEEITKTLTSLLDPQGSTDELQTILKSSSRIKSHYAKLVEALGDSNAELRIRTPQRRQGVKLSATQARDRKEWLKTTVERTKEHHVEGHLTGGSTESHRFELRLENDLWKGDASPEAIEAMKGFKFNSRVKAHIRETTEVAEDVDDGGKVSYFLVRFEEISGAS